MTSKKECPEPWCFIPFAPTGGGAGEAWQNPLEGAGPTIEELLAREALQNSCDALQYGQKQAYVRLSLRNINEEEKHAWRNALRVDELLSSRQGLLGLKPENFFAHLRTPETRPSVCYVEDFNTVGLDGRITGAVKADDHFKKLVLYLGVTDKTKSGGSSGGSYGYGKSVYAACSDCFTVIYYSRIEPKEQNGYTYARLIVASLFNHHELCDEEYEGRAFLGRQSEDGYGRLVIEPFCNEEAQHLAEVFGFSKRKEDEKGTSIAILGANLDADALKNAVEKYWWPKLIENELSCQILDSGKRLPRLSPRKRNDLGPFIKAYEIATGREQINVNANERVYNPDSVNGYKPGRAVFVERTDQPDDEDLYNSLALMRGSRMVIEYKQFGQGYSGLAAGVFVASDKLDSVFKLSEPGAHNKWDPNARRLDEEQSEIVRAVQSRLKGEFRKFLNALAPPQPDDGGRVKNLEKLLGRLSEGKGQRGPKGPVRAKDDFNVEHSVERVAQGDKHILTGTVFLRLSGKSDQEVRLIWYKCSPCVLLDDNEAAGTKLNCDLSVEDDRVIEKREGHWLKVKITKDSPVEVVINSAEFPPDWSVALRERIEGVETNSSTTPSEL